MAIKSMTLLKGATITPTGGTAQTFVPDGVEVPGGVHVADGGQPDFRLREHTTYRTRNPRLVNGKYVKAKRWISHVIPCTGEDGNIDFVVIRNEIEFPPHFTAADLVDARKKGAQLYIDADLDSYYSIGDLS